MPFGNERQDSNTLKNEWIGNIDVDTVSVHSFKRLHKLKEDPKVLEEF